MAEEAPQEIAMVPMETLQRRRSYEDALAHADKPEGAASDALAVTQAISAARALSLSTAAKAMDKPVVITFNKVSYSVDMPVKRMSAMQKLRGFSLRGFPKPEVKRKFLLTDVSGTMLPGTMTSLMGPSGAGKSTLLDVLSGRKNTGYIDGDILFNGHPMTADIKRNLGYVEQTNTLIETLTVRQLLTYTARLRLPDWWTDERRKQRVNDVIEELGLASCADTMIGGETLRGVSGGQAKRVNIGVELITNPRVLFLDEPTTGLDAATSFEVMSVMRHIADGGRSIIATIHQPSTDVFLLFNRLLLLVSGEVTYLGPINLAVSHFTNFGFVYDSKENPADFIVAVTGQDNDDENKQIAGPKVHKRFFAEKYRESAIYGERMLSMAKAQQEVGQASSVSTLTRKPVQFENTRWHNFKVLLSRHWLQKKNDKAYWVARLSKIIFMDFIIATLFNNLPKDETGVYSTVSVLQMSVMTFGFAAMGNIGEDVSQKAFFQRERSSGTYQVSAWFFSYVLSDIPALLMQLLLWALVLYWSVGLRDDAAAFFIFTGVLFVTQLLGSAMGLTFAFLMPTFETAIAFGFPIIILTFVFSGFYVRRPLIPDYFVWLYYISYMTYTLNALAINQFSGSTVYTQTTTCDACVAEFPCPANATAALNNTVCCVSTDQVVPWPNDDILTYWGFGSEGPINNVWGNVVVIVSLFCFWLCLAYSALRFRKIGNR